MKKVKLLGGLFISVFLLGACGDSKEKVNIDASVEKTEETTIETSFSDDEPKKSKTEYNQEIVDDENIKASLMSIEHIIDKTYDEEKIVISFDITNKREKTLGVQAREVSINDRMVDEGLISMSTDIAAGKSATAELEIQDYAGEELPELTGNLELLLHTIDWDDYEYEHDVPVKITLK